MGSRPCLQATRILSAHTATKDTVDSVLLLDNQFNEIRTTWTTIVPQSTAPSRSTFIPPPNFLLNFVDFINRCIVAIIDQFHRTPSNQLILIVFFLRAIADQLSWNIRSMDGPLCCGAFAIGFHRFLMRGFLYLIKDRVRTIKGCDLDLIAIGRFLIFAQRGDCLATEYIG